MFYFLDKIHLFVSSLWAVGTDVLVFSALWRHDSVTLSLSCSSATEHSVASGSAGMIHTSPVHSLGGFWLWKDSSEAKSVMISMFWCLFMSLLILLRVKSSTTEHEAVLYHAFTGRICIHWKRPCWIIARQNIKAIFPSFPKWMDVIGAHYFVHLFHPISLLHWSLLVLVNVTVIFHITTVIKLQSAWMKGMKGTEQLHFYTQREVDRCRCWSRWKQIGTTWC